MEANPEAGRDKGGTKEVHLNAPERLIERADILASLFGKTRTDIMVDALREYIETEITEDYVERQIGREVYSNNISPDELVALVGVNEAAGYRYLERTLQGSEPDVDASTFEPDDSVYGDFDPDEAPTPDE